MSDIVERLRETQDDWPACLVVLEIEAADEIERLREEVERLKSEESCNDVLLEYEQAENKRLREENARLVDILDDVLAQWDGDWPEELYERVKAAIQKGAKDG